MRGVIQWFRDMRCKLRGHHTYVNEWGCYYCRRPFPSSRAQEPGAGTRLDNRSE